ncbi:DNA kinase/phosphatase Pnk1 [Cryptotrichosporon argae]
MSTSKRKATGSAVAEPASKKTVHPFFSAPSALSSIGQFLASPESLIHYVHLDPLQSLPSTSNTGPTAPTYTTIPALPPPISLVTVIFYDLDGTLIVPQSGAPFPKNRTDWQWWHASVPVRLKQEVGEGKHVVVLSNQGDAREKIRAEWRAKVPLIAAKIPDVPLRILAALSKTDPFRKPNTGMFDYVVALYRDKGLEIDMESSVYIGDAAGRAAAKGKGKDHGDTDYKMALNAGLRFLTPEEHFLGQPRPLFPEPPLGFRPAILGDLANLPPVVPSNTPLARDETEVVLFVGPPASGKSSFYRKHFKGKYQHISQDELKTRDKCLKAAREILASGRSVVIDNTNRDKATRAHWVALANELNVPIRVFHFLCPLDLAKHNNAYRAFYGPPNEPGRELLPAIAFTSYAGSVQAPAVDEGFDEVRGVNFVWTGSDEQRKLWDRYLLDSKR